MTPYIVAIFNQKGGISKTTTSTNLSVCLAACGKSVVLIDLDSQGDSTKSLGIPSDTKRGIFDLFTGEARLDEVILETPFPGVRVIPSTYSLAGIEIKLAESKDSQRTLSNIIRQAQFDCDYVVIDCPPALGIMPVNALASANGVIIPVTATPFANDGLIRTLPSIKYVQEGLNKSLLLQGVLFTIHDRNGPAKKISQMIRGRLGSTVYQTEIPRDTAVIEASAARMPVCVYAPRSAAAAAHLDFTLEFLERHQKIVAKQGGEMPPPPPRDEVMAVLNTWQNEFEADRPSQDTVRHQKNKLDRMLYGNRTTMERFHLGLVHFFIDHRMFLLIFLLIVAAIGGAILKFGFDGVSSLLDLIGL